MKLRMYVEVDVSKSLADTIQRNGCILEPDGTGMKVKVPNTPSVPKRKTKVAFVQNPINTLDHAIKSASEE
jgi:hypothetical protein